MEQHRRDATVSAAAGRRANHRAALAGHAMMGIIVVFGVLTLVTDGPIIPSWMWAGLLVVWFASTSLSVNELMGGTGRLLFYGCAVLTSWVLLMTAPGSGVMANILVVVAVVGTYLLSLRWVLGVVLLNCLVIFAYAWSLSGDLAEVAVNTSFYLIIHLAVVLGVYAQWRESHVRAELEQKNLELEAAGVLLADTVASSERLRISRELHDLIGHQLTVLNLELEAAKHRVPVEKREHVDRAGAVAKDLLADVRTTVGELRDAGPGDLQQSLRRLADAVPSLEIFVEVEAGVEADEEVSATLVRAAQEIITNVIKHADASELALTVTHDEGMLTLSGTNDGISPRSITPGHGLTGLRERVELLGGSLSIRTAPHFTVEVRLPVARDRELQI